MGDRNGDPDEYPERLVRVSGFRIDRHEVANEAYALCVRAKACDPSPFLDDPELGREGYPVVGVAFEDAERFCKWVGKRLPWEVEWEYAAKGGDLRKWPWTGPFDPKKANTQDEADGFGVTAPVGGFPAGASPFGILNMAGNAGEWVRDYFDPTYYRTTKVHADPRGPDTGVERVVRGGSYRDSAHTVRVSARVKKSPTEADNTIGLRCAASE